MHMGFYRNQSHSGTNSSWPQIDQKLGYFNSLTPVVFEKLNNQLRLEALPSVTYGGIWDRQSPEKWSAADDATQIGIGIKYGITSSVNAEIDGQSRLQPGGKRPVPGSGQPALPDLLQRKTAFFHGHQQPVQPGRYQRPDQSGTAVHTRNIVDPFWGGKIAGNVGDTFVGFLAAGDEWPHDLDTGRTGQAGTYIGRIKHSLSGDNYIGLLYSGHFFAGDRNQVIAADTHLRLWGRHSLAMTGLFSFSHDGVGGTDRRGTAASLLYQYGQKPLDLFGMLEFMDRDFKMESAFYQRTGITKLTTYIGPQVLPPEQGPVLAEKLQSVRLQLRHPRPSDRR